MGEGEGEGGRGWGRVGDGGGGVGGFEKFRVVVLKQECFAFV